MGKQLGRNGALAIGCLFLVFAPPAWGDYCVDCLGGPGGFWCMGSGIGGQLCRASTTMCSLIGTCPAPPPPPPPPPPNPKDLAWIAEDYFELPYDASMDQPTTLSLASGSDIQAIKNEIATLADVLPAEVILKGGVFGIGELPIDVLGGGSVGDAVFVYRIDKLQDATIRVRTCTGENGEAPTLTSDATVAAEGAVVLVPTTIKEGPAVIAYRVVHIMSDEFEEDPKAPQDAFREDVGNHLDGDPWEMTTGELTGPCQ